ncbi:hydrophobin-like protein [Heterobasidion irregulare TC 32-1]|uniref:Hydrophobin n=1 Tax=Heterobasidion irregulare (strain TC 32-1) TaxID=747525 RepID=W4JS93_HETIT|nr:hydrophobin-like protein [Heterobasidion irregulare TC 32-1]ETW76432.1 hydrophobin-like protein [Heterobasidion irregulare TC 32-1]
MFSILALIPVIALITLASASPTKRTEPASQCDTAPVQCCDSVQSAGSPAAANELGLLGIVVQDLNIPVGLTCTPISVIGVGSGASCDASPVCCEDNSYNGVVAIGCVPVDLSL